MEINVLENDLDPDNDALEITKVENPENGTFTIENGKIKFVPNNDFVGTAKATYTIYDGTDEATAEVKVFIPSGIINHKPVAQDDSATTRANLPVEINVLENDNDEDGDTLTITKITDTQNGTFEIVDGKVKFTPDTNFVGTATAIYLVDDGFGGQATANITVEVSEPIPTNLPPTANPDTATTKVDQTIEIDVLVNDTDPDNDTLTIESVQNLEHGLFVVEGGKVTFSPVTGYVGTATAEYTITDGK